MFLAKKTEQARTYFSSTFLPEIFIYVYRMPTP